MKNILVIGGSGYVGSTLVPQLLSKDYKVRVLDNLIYNNSSSLAHLADHPNFSFMRADFCDKDMCQKALENITDVVLLAAMVGDPICKKYPDLARKVNLDGPVQLFDLLRQQPVDRFIFTSTCSNYGLREDDTPADENSDLKPLSLYAETKVSFEKYILSNISEVKFNPVILRLSTAYGISGRMRFDLTVSDFTKALAGGEKLLVFDENTWRPYCHVSDISKSIMLALNAPAEKIRGQVFNVGSQDGNFTKKMIVNVITGHIPDTQVEYKAGGSDPRNYRVSFDKISNVLGFKADYTVEKSVTSLIKALQSGFFNDVENHKSYYGNYEIKS